MRFLGEAVGHWRSGRGIGWCLSYLRWRCYYRWSKVGRTIIDRVQGDT